MADKEPIRAVPYTHALQQMAQTMVFRSLDRKRDAMAALQTGDGPVPRIGPEWNDSEARGGLIPPSNCRVSTDGSECFVTSLSGNSYVVKYAELGSINSALACSNMCNADSGTPCGHVFTADRKKGKRVIDLINPAYTKKGWAAQYSELRSESAYLPTEADVTASKHLIDRDLKLPPAMARPAGRPKKDDRHPGILEQMCKKKRTMTCQACFQVGHTKASLICPKHPKHKSG